MSSGFGSQAGNPIQAWPLKHALHHDKSLCNAHSLSQATGCSQEEKRVNSAV